MNAPLYEVMVWTGRVQYVLEQGVEDIGEVDALTAFNPAGSACSIGDETPWYYPATEEQLLGCPGGPEALDAWRAHDFSHMEAIDAEMVALDPLLH